MYVDLEFKDNPVFKDNDGKYANIHKWTVFIINQRSIFIERLLWSRKKLFYCFFDKNNKVTNDVININDTLIKIKDYFKRETDEIAEIKIKDYIKRKINEIAEIHMEEEYNYVFMTNKNDLYLAVSNSMHYLRIFYQNKMVANFIFNCCLQSDEIMKKHKKLCKYHTCCETTFKSVFNKDNIDFFTIPFKFNFRKNIHKKHV